MCGFLHDGALRVRDADLQLARIAECARIRELHLDREMAAAVLHRGAESDMVEGDGGHVGEADVAVEAAVPVEIAEVGGDALGIAGVVAEDGDGHLALALGTQRRLGCGVGDVDRPLVVTTEVFGHFLSVHEDLRLLTCAVEFQQGASAGVRVVDFEPGAIPAGTLVVAGIGIHGVTRIEAVREGDRGPCDVVACSIAAPDLPCASEGALIMFPSGGKALEHLCGRGCGGYCTEEQEKEETFHGGW